MSRQYARLRPGAPCWVFHGELRRPSPFEPLATLQVEPAGTTTARVTDGVLTRIVFRADLEPVPFRPQSALERILGEPVL